MVKYHQIFLSYALMMILKHSEINILKYHIKNISMQIRKYL
jgi:hypothetical protein